MTTLFICIVIAVLIFGKPDWTIILLGGLAFFYFMPYVAAMLFVALIIWAFKSKN